jgi:hypothetical protein
MMGWDLRFYIALGGISYSVAFWPVYRLLAAEDKIVLAELSNGIENKAIGQQILCAAVRLRI